MKSISPRHLAGWAVLALALAPGLAAVAQTIAPPYRNDLQGGPAPPSSPPASSVIR